MNPIEVSFRFPPFIDQDELFDLFLSVHIQSFDEVFMPDYVAREIRNQGYARPTPIQSQTWPIAFRYVINFNSDRSISIFCFTYDI